MHSFHKIDLCDLWNYKTIVIIIWLYKSVISGIDHYLVNGIHSREEYSSHSHLQTNQYHLSDSEEHVFDYTVAAAAGVDLREKHTLSHI